MTYGHKLIANKLIAPNGTTQTLVAPTRGALLISRITITSTWEPAMSQGFIPQHSVGYYRYVELNKQGEPYSGYAQNGGGLLGYHYNSDKTPGVLLSNQPSSNYPYRMHIMENRQGVANIGAYSFFSLGIGRGTITGLLDAPDVHKPLELRGPISLGQSQSLQITNGIIPFPGHSFRENYRFLEDNTPGKMTIDTARADHRARASHLRVIVYGQEVT